MVFESAFINRPGFDPHSLLGAPLLLTPTRGDYLGEHTAKAFDEILPGRVLEENAILEAEKSEGTYDPDYLPQQEARDMFGTFPDTPKVRHSHAMSEEDWKASPFYRKEIEYRPDMTRTRARIMAENFDERRYRDALIANGDEVYGPVMKALSFGATLLGSLPDPVNVLPLGGGMRAASLAGKTGLKAAVKAGAKAGVVEGAAGAALSDAIVFPDLRARGEDLGFLDFLLDTAFGATLGGGLGALGGGIHGYLGNRRIEAQDRLARRARLRHEELLREADEREKARLAMETEYGSLDNDFLNSGWHVFEENPDDFFLSRAGKEGGPGRPLITRAEAFLGLIDDADMDIAQRRRWRDLTGEFREQLIKDAGFSTQDAEAMSDILGAHAEVMAPMFGMEPGAWLERRLAGFRNTTPEEFEAARETFLYDARGMETMALRQIESEGRRANPVADTVYGQLDRAAIREAYGQDTVNAIEARYGKGVFAKTRGAKAASKGTLSNDSLAHELVRRGLLPEGSSLDDMVNYLATGEGVDTGRALYQPASMSRPLPQRFAEMPGVEADSSQWFGEGKAIATDTKGLRKNLKKWAKENFSGKTTVSNADTGWEVLVTPKGIEDSLSHGFDEPLARSVPFIPQIVESGIHVASTEKKAGLMSHIFANKIRLDGKDYVVGFVLREDDNGNRFYDHELTEIIDPGWLYRDPLSKKETLYTGPANRGDVMNILRDKLGVNDGSGRVMFQTGADPANARGAIVFRPEDGQALIALFKGKADISTVIHEGAGHFFLENLRAAAQLSNAPAWVRDGWGDVAKAIGADADPARPIGTEAHEAFANMAVDYFRRGEAPSIALTTTFQRFARWLAHIYRALTRRGELKDVTPEVKRIMDRLLVAEDQLRAREINRRVVDARNDEADLLRSGLAGREKRDVMRAQEKALADMAAGRPVDVGPVLRESQVLRKARALQREFPDPENRNASSDRAAPEPDYSVERQDDFPPAPEAKSGEDAEMADMDADAAVDADVEARIADLEARGNLDGEDAALLADAADQAARAERYGEIGQSVLECIMEVAE
ncbi:hypothetical protein [uncultured Desulfovibrio sp.]|uniref:LPD3 domain-containing protein n=1 Tax=uncultured Desulfovibrio sp. TaxID=167968 RepID=UPI00258B8467|nr:hypothetical protein [uncultured Desulfovibrio sp.]